MKRLVFSIIICMMLMTNIVRSDIVAYEDIAELLSFYQFTTRGIAVKENYAYALTRDGDLDTYDVSTIPNLSSFKSYLPIAPPLIIGKGYGVLDYQDYLYVHGYGIAVVTIQNPASPSIVRSVSTLDTVYNMIISGNYLIACERNYVEVFSLGTPSAPLKVGKLFIGTEGWSATVYGDYLYVAGGIENSMLHVVDFSEPRNLSLLNNVPLDELPFHMRVLDNHLITSCTSSAQLWSLSDPLNPSKLDVAPIEGRVCAQESENLIFNGTVLSIEGSSFNIVQTFDTHGGRQIDGFPYGSDVTNIGEHSIVFLAQSRRVLILRSIESVKESQPLSSFTLSLDEGINIVSLPVQPQTPFTARSLAENLGATMVISYDGKQGGFIPFVPEVFNEDGFPIEGGRGYIVNLLESKEVTFTGTVWSNAPSFISASPSKGNPHWAFVVCGEIYDESRIARYPPLTGGRGVTELTVTVENLRTGAVTQAMINQLEQGKFAAALVDMNRKAVVSADELLKVRITDASGNVISGPIKHRISVEEIKKGYVTFNMRLGDIIPEKSALLQNYPNPFNAETWIPYQLPQDTDVKISIYNLKGQLIRTLRLGLKPAGMYISKDKAAHWNGRDEHGEMVGSGVYFYSIEAGNFRATRRMLIVK